MEDKPKTSPRDFFLYLGMIISLYISTISILRLLFEMIDQVFPNPLSESGDPYSAGISIAIASLLVIFPLYVFISWVLLKNENAHPEKRRLGIRKWLLYLTLFIAGITIVVDLIVLLQTFLSGQEITVNFILKILSVLFVIGVIFWFYTYKVRQVDGISTSLAKNFTVGISVFVVVSIVTGFVVMGSPATQRMKRFDQARVYDLQNLQQQITTYWQSKETLPRSLEDLRDPLVGFSVPTDPQTGLPYEYRTQGNLTFVLCAVFELPNSDSEQIKPKMSRAISPEYGIFGEENWVHNQGEECFERTIDPDKFPPRTKSEKL